MKKKITNKTDECCDSQKGYSRGACGGCLYGLGFLGSAVYYISTATGFWMGVWGVIKSLVWPAILVYQLFNYIGI